VLIVTVALEPAGDEPGETDWMAGDGFTVKLAALLLANDTFVVVVPEIVT
jgi:hypothetical protein